MLYNYGAQPEPYVIVRVTCRAVISHWFTYAPPRCRTSQFLRTFIPLTISSELSSCPLFDRVGLAVFKSRANAFLLAQLLAPFLSPTVLPFSSFILWVGIVGRVLSDC